MKIRVFYMWYDGDEGGYGSCEKENFLPHHRNGMTREALFEYNERDEFVKKFKERIPEESDMAEKLADEHCPVIS